MISVTLTELRQIIDGKKVKMTAVADLNTKNIHLRSTSCGEAGFHFVSQLRTKRGFEDIFFLQTAILVQMENPPSQHLK
jgi:hypothetical protein